MKHWLIACVWLASLVSSPAVILWSDLGATAVHESGIGNDILNGSVKRDNASTDALYFKFHIDLLSDVSTEKYFAAFELFEKGTERLAVGNSLEAWAYSAFNTSEKGESNSVFGDLDLHSSRPEPSGIGAFFPYELPRRGIESTIVFKVQYVPDGDDLITVWLNPDLAPGATEAGQLEKLTTRFKANASFDEIHLRHGGGGGGWTFSDLMIATAFNDFVTPGSSEPDAITRSLGRGASPFTVRSWQSEQGLPQNSVRALAQTSDGYLWVGSDDGVARFDGLRFVSFGLREGLRTGPVRVLLGDSQGALWMGSADSGLVRLRDGQFKTFTSRDGLPSDSITSLAEDNEGHLWIGTEAGLAIWDQTQIKPLETVSEFKGKAITTLFKDRRGVIWLGVTGSGIFRLVNGKFLALTDPSVDSLLQMPHCLLVDRAGRIWVGAGDDFVLCRDGDQWRRYRIPRHLARPYISSLAEEPDGTVWAGSVSEGLFQFREGKLGEFNASSGLSDNLVESLFADREGGLWVGTTAGLNRLQRKNLFAFGQNEGLGYGAVQGLAEIAPGQVWAGKPSDGLYHWEGRNFNPLNAAGLSRRDPQVNAVMVTRDGSCWAASAHGLTQFKDPKNAPDNAEPIVLEGLNVIALNEDAEGALWAGTREGQVWRRWQGNWEPKTNLWQAHAVTAILKDGEGWMWLGTEGEGLYRLKGDQSTHFDKNKNGGLLSDLIRTLYLDAKGTLWIGTAGGGLSRWSAGKISTFTTREGLPDNTISQILEDNNGHLWLGSNRGIACLNKSEMDELAPGRSVYPQVYGQAEGMLSEECTGGFFPAGLKTKSGLLWFSTLKGIIVADPRPRATDAPPPTVVLEELLLDGKPEAGLGSASLKVLNENLGRGKSTPELLRIPPGKHRVEFRYTGLSFKAPERVRFRYQLEGLDANWVEAETLRTALYSYVPPGEYRFRVIACNGDGVWNETGASVALKSLPYFWQTWWCISLVSLGVMLTVGGSVRFVEKAKIQNRLKHLEQERALQRERARIAQDLHDDLGSSLTRISLLSGLARADKDHPQLVDTHTTKIAQSAAQTVRALEEIVWAVRPGSDSLQSLLEYIAHFANELFEGDSARCRLDLPSNIAPRPLPPEIRHDIFLVVKESLTNALKHAAATEVRVQAKISGNELVILVQDNGRGFDPEAMARSGRNGLGNMRRRAEAMGGSLQVISEAGKGTTIRLEVHLPGQDGTGEA